MRLARFNAVTEPVSRARTGAVIADGLIADLRAAYARFLVEEQGDAQGRELAALRIPADVKHILHVGKPALAAIEQAIEWLTTAHTRDANARGIDGEPLFTPAASARLHNPLKPGRILVVADAGVEEWAPASVMGPVRDLPLPAGVESLSYRGGLGLVIGRACRAVSERDALSTIAGYTVANAITTHHCREGRNPGSGLPFRRCIIGPHLVTPEHVEGPGAMRIATRVNDQESASGSTRPKEASLAKLISQLSVYGLEAGDLIVTALLSECKPGVRAGDVLETEAQGLGTMRNKVAAERSPPFFDQAIRPTEDSSEREGFQRR